ncbi:hypothetical protein PYW08_008793 [Mythimna loreyi]|uniref:Uncharacterized protein n=1 Tax=Mythimna loreyi TaxID=667449 RepID=A0ACC2QAM7_9NEOP|nr:hypothetical protein PYW08_008793 [Mythimna loreyi]
MPMRAVSAISLKSAKHSRDYEKYPTSFDDGSRIVDFDNFVKTSCKLFECPISIQVIRKIECPLKLAKRHGSKTKRKRSTEPPAPSLPTTHHSSHVTESESEPDITRLSLTAVYNHQHELLEPAEPTLLVLNLSSNHITDVGAKHLAEALRNNRHLRYLNISDNHVGDDGAKFIFEVLAEFPLNNNEIQDKKRILMYSFPKE